MRRGRYDDYYDEVYGRTPPRRRRKKRGRGFLLLLVLLLALGALYMVRSGGLRVLSVPQENIETDFEVDLEATPFMSEQSEVSAYISLTPGEIPYLLQYDSRWAYHRYGSSYMGYTACGPTCLSMAALALTGNSAYTPPYVADWAEANGHYVPGAGTAWTLFTSGAAAFGLNGQAISAGRTDLAERLERGEIIVASMLPGDFTTSGHFILIVSSEALGFRVYDPNSMALSRRYWTYDDLAPQIAQLWSITAA